MRSRAEAMVAPVLPADTMARAWPSRTASAARTSERVLLPTHPLTGIVVHADHLGGVQLRQPAGVPHLPRAPHQQHADARPLGDLSGAGHDLTWGPIATHGVDRDREGGQRLTRRPGGSRH